MSSPRPDTGWSDRERVGCGCLLVLLGSVAFAVGYLWVAADDFFGQATLGAREVALGGLAAVGCGVYLILRRPR